METREVLTALLSPKLTQRELGSVRLRGMLSTRVEDLVRQLCDLAGREGPDVAAMALHVLRTEVIDSGQWRLVLEPSRRHTRTSLLQLILCTPHPSVKRLAVSVLVSAWETECLGEDFARLMEQWTADPEHCLSALWLLSEVVSNIKDTAWFPVLWTRLSPALLPTLTSTHPDICISAVNAVSLLITHLPSPIDPRVKSTSPVLLTALTTYLGTSQGQESSLHPVLTHLIDMTEQHPCVWDSCTQLSSVLITLSESHYFDALIRQKAVEFIRVLVVSTNLQREIIEKMIDLGFKLMSEIDENEGNLQELAGSLLENISEKHSNSHVFSLITSKINTLLRSSLPTHHIAALQALTSTISPLHSLYSPILPSLFPILHSFFHSSPSINVIKTTFKTITAICSEFEPFLEGNELICRVFVEKGLEKEAISESCEMIMRYFMGFEGNEDAKVALFPYISSVLHTLETGLYANYPQKHLLIDTIAIISHVLKQEFRPFLTHFLNIMQNILKSEQGEVQYHCLTAIGLMVSGENSENKEIAPVIEDIFMLGMKESEKNEQFQTTFEVNLASFAMVLGEKIVPFLDFLVGRLLAKVSKWSETEGEYVNSYESQQRNAAVKVLHDLVKSCGRGYSPWVERTVKALMEWCSPGENWRLCKYSIKTIGAAVSIYLPLSSREGLIRLLLPDFLDCLKSPSIPTNYRLWLLKSLIKQLTSMHSPSILGLPLAIELSATLAEAFSSSLLHRHTDPIHSSIISHITSILSHLLLSFKHQYRSCFTQYFLTFYDYLLLKSTNPHEVAHVSTILTSLLEHTEDFMIVNKRSLAIEKLISCMDFEPAQLMALKGIEISAERCRKEIFEGYAGKCKEICEKMLDAKAESVSWRAMATLGVVLIFHFKELVGNWLQLLPLDSPHPEAQAVHSVFLRLRPQIWSIASTEAQRVMYGLRLRTESVVGGEDSA